MAINSRFDTELSGFGGGDGGNNGGFVPSGSLYYVHRVTDDLMLGIDAGSYFGLGADHGDDWSGRCCRMEFRSGSNCYGDLNKGF